MTDKIINAETVDGQTGQQPADPTVNAVPPEAVEATAEAAAPEPEKHIEALVRRPTDGLVVGIAAGFVLGVAVGFLIDKVAVCLVAGLLLGTAVGYAADTFKIRKSAEKARQQAQSAEGDANNED